MIDIIAGPFFLAYAPIESENYLSLPDDLREKYMEKLKRYYDSENKLLQYPSKRPMRMIALARIAEKFELEKKYTEKEVNEIINEAISFSDIELIRREMFQYKFIGRLRDGSEYWLEQGWKEMQEDQER